MAAVNTPDQAVIRINHVRGLVTVLQTIKSNNKSQQCTVSLDAEGLRIRWEDDSKSLQSSVFLRPELFSEYRCPWGSKNLGLQLGLLMDTLTVFSSGGGAELTLRFPGPDQELLFEATESGGATTTCTYASVSSIEIPYPADLNDYWQDPVSYFLLPGELLKEAAEDLEWAAGGGAVRLKLSSDPAQVTMSACGSVGDLKITFPSEKLAGFQCAEPEILHSYKYRNLRTALANLPVAKDGSCSISSKVTLDSGGLMKVTHMLGLAGAPAAEAQGGTYMGSAAYADSQRPAPSRMAVVNFLLLPEEEGFHDEY